VRVLLNSWLIPNDTRVATDRFHDLARSQNWTAGEAAVVRSFRDDLRDVVEGGPRESGRLNKWIGRLDIRPAVADGTLGYRHEAGPAGDFLAVVLESVSAGTWARLKACPDCRWVFYDNTRNGSKRWCLMQAAGRTGRGCGDIAKVRRFRERHANRDAGVDTAAD
jgi:CGNR zinc finger protein